MSKKLADRDGTYTPDIEDRRRIAVSELIMSAQVTQQITGKDLKDAVLHNIIGVDEIPVMGPIVTERIIRIANGTSEY
jgi:hypothetical protein